MWGLDSILPSFTGMRLSLLNLDPYEPTSRNVTMVLNAGTYGTDLTPAPLWWVFDQWGCTNYTSLPFTQLARSSCFCSILVTHSVLVVKLFCAFFLETQRFAAECFYCLKLIPIPWTWTQCCNFFVASDIINNSDGFCCVLVARNIWETPLNFIVTFWM